ncbi:hypothetical protein OCU04_006855 [Sclerotinia nivalis]|uniref:Aminoglycoside phosphotransferase domain-containing protein n=1 Tax=Sclerotinia nivalis TaxID=352851 RepID=A0A9X0AKR0_9HELO|nr:hypothetical protein OCU04_006855 [Sclerotinia nivalis]
MGGKIDHSNNRLDYCIAEHYLRDMIPSIDVPASTIPSEFANGYPLHHPDLSSSNIFVDEDFNISCIIDWTYCSTVPMAMLLTTPSLPQPRSDIDSSLIPFFRSGFGHTTFEEQIWISAQRSWWFSRLVSLDGLRDYHYFTELYTSIYKPKDIIDIPRLFRSARDEEMFRGLAAELRMEDRSVGKIAKDEGDYFRCMKLSNREAVARKLTLVSEFNRGFVADKRLWRWLDEALDDD